MYQSEIRSYQNRGNYIFSEYYSDDPSQVMVHVISQQCLHSLPLLIKSARHCVNDDVLVFVIMSMCSVISWHMASVSLSVSTAAFVCDSLCAHVVMAVLNV